MSESPLFPRSWSAELGPRARPRPPVRPRWAVWLAVAVMVGVPVVGQTLLLVTGERNNISWSMWSGR